MDIHLDRRAQIAYQSLQNLDKTRVERVLQRLQTADASNWTQHVQAQRLQVFDREVLYSIRAGISIRLLVKILAGALIVMDIFPRERLERISGKQLP